MLILWGRLFLRQRGLSFEKISPNWFVLLILLINIGLWALAIAVAGNMHGSLCQLNEAQPFWLGKLLCR